MNLPSAIAPGRVDSTDAAEFRRAWGWLLALGLGMVLLGLVALGSLPFVTLAYVFYLGFMLILAGILSCLQAFQVRRSSHFLLALLGGVLDIVVGFLMVNHVGEAAAVMTLLLATFFFVGGIFRLVAAAVLCFPNWPWTVFSGVVSVMLGVSIWRRWPYDSFWVIGLFIGIELLVRGCSVVMLALAARRVGA
jgi:uncharacterized membrane protein HdeD (DUF308 family)